MDEPRPEKVALVEEVRGRLSHASAALVTEYRGLRVDQMAALRRSLRPAGAEYKVYKNTLVRFAVRELGLEALEPLLEGPVAIAFVQGDPAATAGALRDFGRAHPQLVLKGGLLNDSPLSAEQARALADLPPREVLLAQVAWALAAPLRQLAWAMKALTQNLAYGLQALIDQRRAAERGASAGPGAGDLGESEAAGGGGPDDSGPASD